MFCSGTPLHLLWIGLLAVIMIPSWPTLAESTDTPLKPALLTAEQREQLEEKMAEQLKLAEAAEAAENFTAARQSRQEVLAIRKELFGENHWQVIDARIALEDVDLLAGLTHQARVLLRDVSNHHEKAIQLKRARKYNDALSLANKAVEINFKILGENHRSYAQSLCNLAALHRGLGQLAEATALYRKAFEINRNVLGKDHPKSITSIENLFASLKQLSQQSELAGDFASARKFRQEVLNLALELRGAKQWRVSDAHRELDYIEEREKMSRELRHLLADADRLTRQASNLRIQGKPRDALAPAQKAVEIRKKVLGDKHLHYAESLTNLSALYHALGDYTQGESFGRQALEVVREVQGDKHPAYAVRLYNLGAIYLDKKDDTKAEPLLRQALEIQKEALGETHPVYAGSLNGLAILYSFRGAYSDAEPFLRQVLEIRKAVYGEKHSEYAESLNNLAGLYQNMGKFSKAEPLLQEAREICLEVHGDSHPTYAASLNNLGFLYKSKREFDRAEALYLQALEIVKQRLGTQHDRYIATLRKLAELFKAKKDYSKAESYYRQVLEIIHQGPGEKDQAYSRNLKKLAEVVEELAKQHIDHEDFVGACAVYHEILGINTRLFGEKHWRVITYRLRLAQVERLAKMDRSQQHRFLEAWQLTRKAEAVRQRGRLAEATRLAQQVMETYKEIMGEEDIEYSISMNNLATLYHEMGDIVRAEEFMHKAVEISKCLLGEAHPDYAQRLINLGGLYSKMGAYDMAENCLQEGLQITREAIGVKNSDYAYGLCVLAALSSDKKDYVRSESLLREAALTYRQLQKEEDPEFARILHNLGSLRYRLEDPEQAEMYLQRALKIRKGTLGEEHLSCAISYNNLGLLYLGRNDHTRAEPLLRKALVTKEKLLKQTFSVQSGRQRLGFLCKLRHTLDAYISAALTVELPTNDLYRHILVWKGSIATCQVEELLSRDQPELRPLIDELTEVRVRLDRLSFSVPIPEQREAWLHQIDELRNQKEDLESRLAQQSVDFRREQVLAELGPDEVIQSLPEGTVFVDFIAYFHASPSPTKKGQIQWEERYLAFVLRRAHKPVCIPLGAAQPIQKTIQSWRQALFNGNARTLEDASVVVAELVWKPLQPYVEGVRTFLYGPDGALCQIPLAALPGKRRGTYLIQDLTIGQIASGRHAVQSFRDCTRLVSSGLLAIGGIDYDATLDGEQRAAIAPSQSGQRNAMPRSRFLRLPGTESEARNIHALFKKTFFEEPSKLMTGAQPHERRIKEELSPMDVAKRWRYLHLATHGFFVQSAHVSTLRAESNELEGDHSDFLTEEEAQTLALNPQMLSGIVVAGANHTTNGLLTAEVVAGLDLRGMDMVVLSACDTGLGKVISGEGVLGLQRAFQVAGAQTVVASLWKVDDEITQQLLVRFYENLWQKKMSRLEALRQAQLAVLRGEGNRSHPRYWAAWVLSGDPGDLVVSMPPARTGLPEAVAVSTWWSGWPVYATGAGALAVIVLALVVSRRRHVARNRG